MTKDIREVIRLKYARAISQKKGCCGDSRGGGCCGSPQGPATEAITGGLYRPDEVGDLLREAADASFGCGNPTALAELRPGEVVLDLGSGAGLDVLLSARRVAPGGKAYGLDMTDEMLAEARANQEKAGIQNVEFLKGHIEEIPLPENTVDVIISNCVINLSVDKDRVLQEAYRVLKPGGRLAVSDIILTRPLPCEVQKNLLAWAGCVAGAMLEKDYRYKLAAAGFRDIGLEVTRRYNPDAILQGISEAARREADGAVVSAFIRARKPAALVNQ
mgnify:CR=1 FL=1